MEDQTTTQGTETPLTFGQKAVGIKFNPSNLSEVDKCKQLYADIIDQMNDLLNTTTDGQVRRLCSVAITEAQGAQMWAVKAITWQS